MIFATSPCHLNVERTVRKTSPRGRFAAVLPIQANFLADKLTSRLRHSWQR
jgi:hypothetical protein